MFTLSAFADEIDPDPEKQIEVLRSCGIRFIELRSIHQNNVLNLTDQQVDDYRALLDRNGMGISAIGTPIGKAQIDESFDVSLTKLNRAIQLARRFGTNNIRVFSYYLPIETADWPTWRDEVVQRLTVMTNMATAAGVRLLHENEHRIYGDSPERVADMLQAVPGLFAVYDPANFVFCGYDPWAGWLACRERAVHLHIKDWVHGEDRGRVAGEGQGQIRDMLADAVHRGYDGFATLEPHLLGGGPTGGVTGPELFPRAVEAFRDENRAAGGVESTS
jgi:sugar phosphate isomerase/epimerase